MNTRFIFRCARSAAWVALFSLPTVGCATELRSGVTTGAATYLADATYGILSLILPFPLGEASSTNGGDPFANDDVPLQM